MPKITELKNGLKIITEKIPDIHSATISVLVSAGSAVEDKNNNGASHFVEHLLFKGTEKRSAQIIAQAIEDYGGNLNAFTEKELTYYYARVLSDQALITVDIFCDMLLNSLFDKEELELERQVILEEIKMYEDTPDELVYDVLFKAIWDGSPLALSVTGSYDTVKDLSRDSVMEFVNRFYTPSNIVFSLAGNFDELKVIEIIESHFDDLKSSFKPIELQKPEMLPGIKVQEKDIEQAHICLATRGIPITAQERYALASIDIALSGGISSRLFQEIREKRGLAYSINSFKALYKPTGIYGIYAGTSVPNIDEVIKIVLAEFAKIKENGLTEDELARSKKQLKGSMLLGLESTYYRSYRNVHGLVYFDKIYSVDEICTLIDKISMDEIKKLANYLFNEDYYALSIVGPKGTPQEYSLKAC